MKVNKIVIIAPFLFNYVGGAEKVLTQIYSHLEKKGYELTWITNDNLPQLSLNYNFDFKSEYSKHTEEYVRKIIDDDCYIIACGFSALYLLNYCSLSNKIIFIPFETVLEISFSIMKQLRELMSKSNICNIIVFSEYFKEFMLNLTARNITLVKYNLPAEEQTYIKQTLHKRSRCDKNIFIPTRISPRKNLEGLITVALNMKNYNLNFIVSGGLNDTPYASYAENIRRMNLKFGSPVIFNECSLSNKEMAKQFTDCICVVSTSLIEGFGIFALEAFNYLKPVVAFDSIGIRELAQFFGYNGPAMFIKSDVDSMIEAITNLHLNGSNKKNSADITHALSIYNETMSFESQLDHFF